MGTLDKIVALLNENNKQQKDLMDFLGVSKSTFNKWKKGENKSYLKHVQKIAEFLGTSSAYLLGETEDPRPIDLNFLEYEKFVEIPIIGLASAGLGCHAEEDFLGKETTPVDWINPYCQYRYILVEGDSMEPKISDGDRLLVQIQSTVDNGDYAVVLIDGEKAVVKRFYHEGNKVILRSLNPKYKDREFRKYEMNRLRIYGRVVKVVSDL